MKRDIRGLDVSTDSDEAATKYDLAVEHYLKYHLDTMQQVHGALAADPGFLMGHIARGYLMLAGANPAHRPLVAQSLTTAEAQLGVATPRERRHIAALKAWQRGALGEAFAIWRELLDADPTDLLAVQDQRHHAVPSRPDATGAGTGGPTGAALVARPAGVRMLPIRLGLCA